MDFLTHTVTLPHFATDVMTINRLATAGWHYFELLRSNYWFIPTLMIIASLLGAFVVLEVDARGWIPMPEWLSPDTADGARQILATIAGAAITIAGVTFSITMVTLSLTSQQFGPRTLRNFLSDRGNQFTLGTFVATFTYCLTILGSVRGESGSAYVPEWAIIVALLQALLCVFVLVYFIHHVASNIRGPAIIRELYKDARSILFDQYPNKIEGTAIRGTLPENFEDHATWIEALEPGYIQNFNLERLLSIASTYDLLIKLERRAGEFIYHGCPVMQVAPAHKVNDKIQNKLLDCLLVGSIRTPEKDPTHQPERMTELAVRALSPGINDPYSAIECLNWLSDLLVYIAHHEIPHCGKRDEDGTVRVWMNILDFGQFMDRVFDPIRQYGKDSVLVIMRMCTIYLQLTHEVHRMEDFNALQAHLDKLKTELSTQFNEQDTQAVKQILEQALNELEKKRCEIKAH